MDNKYSNWFEISQIDSNRQKLIQKEKYFLDKLKVDISWDLDDVVAILHSVKEGDFMGEAWLLVYFPHILWIKALSWIQSDASKTVVKVDKKCKVNAS